MIFIYVVILSIVDVNAPTAADNVPTGRIDDDVVVVVVVVCKVIDFCSSIICFLANVIKFRTLSSPSRTQADKAERNIFISAASYLKKTKFSFFFISKFS